VKVRKEPSWKNAALLGLALGVCFLNRSIVLGLVPVLFVIYVLENFRKHLKPAIISIAFLTLAIAPWVIRNYIVMDSFILLSTRGGYNLWLRNNPYYYADELEALGVEVPQTILDGIKNREFLDYFEFTEDQDEVERNRIITEAGVKFIKANPKLFAYLCWVRFRTIVGFAGTLSQDLIYKLIGLFSFGWIAPLSLAAAFYWRKRLWDILPLAMVFLYFVGVYTLTHDGLRYRLPADPCLIVLAASLLAAWIDKILLKMKQL
jgi:hypothetical protein